MPSNDILGYPDINNYKTDVQSYPADYPQQNANSTSTQSVSNQSTVSATPVADPTPPDAYERALLQEAFERGFDNQEDLAAFLFQRRHKREPEKEDRKSSEWKLLSTGVVGERTIYRRNITAEFQSLPPYVQRQFQSQNKKSGLNPLENYFNIRPVYYRSGYRDPAKTIFQMLVPPEGGAMLLNYRIQTCIHQRAAEKLDKLKDKLNSYSPGLADEIARQIKDVGGFVPRFIAQTNVLSNHALGLAMDINASWNPQIKSSVVAGVIKRVTGFDFSKSLIDPSMSYPDIDRALEIYNQAEEASNRLKTWLQQQLKRDKEFQEELKKAQDELKAAKTKEDKAKAQQSQQKVQQKINDDADLKELQILKRNPQSPFSDGQRMVENWSQNGINNLPLLLVIALKDLGFKWGEEYKDSKDAMHFELLGVIPKEPALPNSLNDLLQSQDV